MPELPEVETVRRTLSPLVGATIRRVWDSGQGLHMRRCPPRARLRRLVGATFTAVRRHGKYLLLDTDTPLSVLCHLGMTGRLLIVPADRPRAKHTHVVVSLGEHELRFSDPRRFGLIDVLEREHERDHPALADLGPDPLVDGIDAAALAARAKTRQSPLKAFLLDQGVLAGVGNIYASEALWLARLSPTLRANRLSRAAARRLAEAVEATLRGALDNGGTTLSDFLSADGREGENAEHLKVYGRAGEPCLRCATRIRRAVHQGRATYYCPRCQSA